MREDREGFVIWIDTAESTDHVLRGAAEWTRSAQRVEFGSVQELERFLKRCIATRDAQQVEGTERAGRGVDAARPAGDGPSRAGSAARPPPPTHK